MIKKSIYTVVFLIVVIHTSYGQLENINLAVIPSFEIPFGPLSSTGGQMYSFGGSAALTGDIPFSSNTLFFGTGMLDFSLIGTTRV